MVEHPEEYCLEAVYTILELLDEFYAETSAKQPTRARWAAVYKRCSSISAAPEAERMLALEIRLKAAGLTLREVIRNA